MGREWCKGERMGRECVRERENGERMCKGEREWGDNDVKEREWGENV